MRTMTVVLDQDTADWVRREEPNKRNWSRFVNALIREEIDAQKELETEAQAERENLRQEHEAMSEVVEHPNTTERIMSVLYEHKNRKWPDGTPLFDNYAYQYIVERRHESSTLTVNQKRYLRKLMTLLEGYLERCDPDVLRRPA